MNDIEILEKLLDEHNRLGKSGEEVRISGILFEKILQAIENLINRVKELEEYSNWHIEHLTGTIEDYIDDDRKGNATLIGELKEEREFWKDIIRIIRNEKTYIDYKNY